MPDFGEKAENYMKIKTAGSDEPMGELEAIKDFLPPPHQLVLKESGVKVTLSLSKRSVDFFKAQALRSKVPYQKMIRRVVDGYASKYSDEGV